MFRRRRVSKSRNVGNLHPPAASKSDPRLLGVSFSHPLGYLAFRCSANNFVASCFSTLAPSFSRSFSSRVREYCSAPVIIFFSLKTFIALFTSSLFFQGNPCCPSHLENASWPHYAHFVRNEHFFARNHD